jgi:dihydrolipoamide dehydrogenase
MPGKALYAFNAKRRPGKLSAAFSLALEMAARLEVNALTIHAHPTLSEAFHESALAALGHPLHI